MSHSTKRIKSETMWPIECQFIEHQITSGAWVTQQTQLVGFKLIPDDLSANLGVLQLQRSERKDYRNNLKADPPKLYAILYTTPQREICTLTASPRAAQRFMDQKFLVLSNQMPEEVRLWIESYVHKR
ncbi:DUF3305 domain-containing protein [Vibrio mangrovi]|uniref:DUF3305 domain-containing protein n=1 Tax=Vibrio mangrovi TaxID=474394 RepID=A0A1Y6ISU6_9VIBR|nr:DUF3305 domain-containing protein [Vibrio mangrovi]MDW6004049.1 DUF3305 domain-containing protein [Vibrio mangrovi]SMR99153.1 hypothetical protein VIM7927_00376 [Vibrio mangrovi]